MKVGDVVFLLDAVPDDRWGRAEAKQNYLTISAESLILMPVVIAHRAADLTPDIRDRLALNTDDLQIVRKDGTRGWYDRRFVLDAHHAAFVRVHCASLPAQPVAHTSFQEIRPGVDGPTSVDGVLSCPFCGGGTWISHDKLPRPTWAVCCRACAATGPWSKISAADAAVSWNQRFMRVETDR